MAVAIEVLELAMVMVTVLSRASSSVFGMPSTIICQATASNRATATGNASAGSREPLPCDDPPMYEAALWL